MAHIHEIGIAADTRGFDQGIKSGVIKPVEDAVDAFKDLERSVDGADYTNVLTLEKDLDKVGDAADRAGRDGAKGIDRLEDALRDAQKETQDLDRKTRDVGDGAERSYGRMRDAGVEASGELRQNLGETFSSFRGDLEDLPQIAQDVFGGLAGSVSSLVGSFALAAGAAGIGLLIAAWQAMQEEQEKSKERIADWADAYIEAGGRVLSSSQTIAAAQAIITDGAKWEEASRNAEDWGVNVETAVLAMSGHSESIKEVGRSLDEQDAAYGRLLKSGEANTKNVTESLGKLQDGRHAYEQLTGEMEKGRAQADVMSQALINVARSTEGATTVVDEFGDTIISLPDGKQIYIDAETGKATQDVDSIEQKIYGIKDKTATVRLRLNTDEWDKWVPGVKVGQVRTAVGPGGAGGTTWY